MPLTRRAALAALAATTLMPAPMVLAEGRPAFVSACRTANGDYAAAVLDDTGRVVLTETLDARGHDAAIRHDPATAVMFARRPGLFAVVIDLQRLKRTTVIAPPEDRRFAGHGFFSVDGKLLYATENDFDGERGVIGVYDATGGYKRVGEFPTYGVGPHEALLLSDGRTIAVANGGILTHPDFPRLKLNLATMEPSMVLIDAATGDLIRKAVLPAGLHQLSLRHMAEVGKGTLWFGAQYEGPKTDRVPLVGTFGVDEDIAMIEAPADVTGRFDQYVGSVAASADGAHVVTTSPRGGVVVAWDVTTRRAARVIDLPDACGAAPGEVRSGFAITSGTGSFQNADAAATATRLAFDNHLAAI